jgi:hypothetical protein
MEYTKGEWVADIRVGCVAVHVKDDEKYHCLDGAAKDCIYFKHGYSTKKPDGIEWNVYPEDEANANLIAAAPDMYEALESMIKSYTYHCPEADEHSNAIKTARAALAKARGKQEGEN